jgi:hypothetical protein
LLLGRGAFAGIEAAAPKDEIEAAFDVQMACAHTAAMAVLANGGQQFVRVEHCM